MGSTEHLDRQRLPFIPSFIHLVLGIIGQAAALNSQLSN